MQSSAPCGEQSLSREEELEARILALEAIVGALLRFSAGQQDLATALKEARQRGETFLLEQGNVVPAEYVASYRGSFHQLAVSMIPLENLATFRSNLQDISATIKAGSVEDPRDAYPAQASPGPR